MNPCPAGCASPRLGKRPNACTSFSLYVCPGTLVVHTYLLWPLLSEPCTRGEAGTPPHLFVWVRRCVWGSARAWGMFGKGGSSGPLKYSTFLQTCSCWAVLSAAQMSNSCWFLAYEMQLDNIGSQRFGEGGCAASGVLSRVFLDDKQRFGCGV